MDDLIYRNNAIAEENIDPHGRPARMNLKNSARRFPNIRTLDTKNRK